MRHLPEYLQYLWKSTNQHGVHSPFVYDLVTRAFYRKHPLPEHRTMENLQPFNNLPPRYRKAVNHSLHHLFQDGAPIPVTVTETSPLSPETHPVVFLDLTKKHSPFSQEAILGMMDDNSVLLVKKTGSHPLWESLRECNDINLTIDCFRVGFIFKRPQQAKENFTIRL